MRSLIIFISLVIGIFLIDQGIKNWAVARAIEIKTAQMPTGVSISEAELVGTTLIAGKCIDLELHFNKGVAFSLFAFLGPYMKWVQGSLVLLLLLIIYKERYLERYAFPAGLVIGGAIGNVYDRFFHEGVVDYVAWHCGFHFAVFNFADVAIDLAFVILLIMMYLTPKKQTS